MEKLYRSRNNKIIGGVCGGVGEYLEVDPVLVRLVWGVLFLFGGIGLLAYFVAWLIIPLQYDTAAGIQDNPKVEDDTEIQTKNNTRLVLGLILVLAGTMLLARDWWYFDSLVRDLIRIGWRYFIPAFLVGIGVYIIFKGDGARKQ